MSPTRFRKIIYGFYRANRRDFPWRRTRNPYAILVSEIMLQQTQTSRVELKYGSFLEKFPTVHALAKAPMRNVLREWQGLGYNRRAIALKRLAEIVIAEHRGKIPKDPGSLAELPGLGPASGGAIAAFAYNVPSVFIETNIRRAYIHEWFPKRKTVADKEIIPLVGKTLDKKNPKEWYYALMDYGAMLGKTLGRENPNRRSTGYKVQASFAGSDRAARGMVVKNLLAVPSIGSDKLRPKLNIRTAQYRRVLRALEKEGIVIRRKGRISIPS